MSKYVYLFGGGTAEGDGTMKSAGRQRRRTGGNEQRAFLSRRASPSSPTSGNLFFDKNEKALADVEKETWEVLAKRRSRFKKKLGDATDPAASVRAPPSCPA